jgi:DNA-binding transcriptional LysR family regulator
MTQKLTLEALEVLDAIDRKGSFAAAAAALYRVPSKITYTVNKLEEELGVTLFRREGRRSVLTPAGQTLLEQGREILEAAERLVETTRQVDKGWESRLNIALDSLLEMDFLAPYLGEFTSIQPDVEINIYEEVLAGTIESVVEGRADLAVGGTEMPGGHSGLRCEKLITTQWVFAVSAEHPLRKVNHPLEEKDIEPYRAVVVRDSSREMPALSRRVFDRQSRLVVTSVAQKIQAQQAGLGVGFLPEFRIADSLKAGTLVALPMAEPVEDSDLFLLWKSNNKGRALQWFVSQLLDS